MTTKELSKINEIVREMIRTHMVKNSMTLNGFAKASGVHQNQLWLYLFAESGKGLHSSTLEKIGKYLST
jgi:hypothetical protein